MSGRGPAGIFNPPTDYGQQMGSPRNVVEVNTREAGVELYKAHRYEDSKAVARRDKEAWHEAEEIMEDVCEGEKAYPRSNSQPTDLAAKVVHILLSLRVGDDPAGVAVVARRWFEQGWELLGGPLREMVDGRDPVLAATVAPRGFETFMLAETEASYEDGHWLRFLAELARLPDALFEVAALVPDESRPEFWHAASSSESPYFMSFRLDRYAPDAISLVLKARHELLLDGAAGEQRVIAFLRDLVSVRAVDYAEVSYGYGGTELTMLELDLPRSPLESVPQAGAVLRGFSWVTVIPAGIAARLGGAPALAATGAFHRVKPLPSGEVWLQATEHFDDWDDVSAAKVFAVLTPFLPPGAQPLSYSRHTDSVRPVSTDTPQTPTNHEPPMRRDLLAAPPPLDLG